MSTLITGASGFSGLKLSQRIVGKKILLSRNSNFSKNIKQDVQFINCNLNDSNKLDKIIDKYKPKEIFHLAGSFTGDYDIDYNTNVNLTRNLLESVKHFSKDSKVLLIGSASEYGKIQKNQCPIDENHPLSAYSTYALTKIYQKSLMDYYVNTQSLNILMARTFNLFGKGISSLLFIGKLYEEIEKVKKGYSDKIKLGNLESERDYLSIDDAVGHYTQIMKKGIIGEVYNVGSGFPTKTKDILKKILKEEKLDFNIIKSNTRFIQANDSDCIYSNITKLKLLYDEKGF